MLQNRDRFLAQKRRSVSLTLLLHSSFGLRASMEINKRNGGMTTTKSICAHARILTYVYN